MWDVDVKDSRNSEIFVQFSGSIERIDLAESSLRPMSTG